MLNIPSLLSTDNKLGILANSLFECMVKKVGSDIKEYVMSDKFFAFLVAAKALLFGVARKVEEHDQKVTHTRYCKICGRLADFRIRTGFRDMTPGEMSFHLSRSANTVSEPGASNTASLLLVHNPTFRVCQIHHPDIGKNRIETREYLHKINPKLAVRLIEPTQLL